MTFAIAATLLLHATSCLGDAPPAPAAAPGTYVFRTGLGVAVPAPRSASRTLIRQDPVEDRIVQGTFTAPRVGDELPTPAPAAAAPGTAIADAGPGKATPSMPKPPAKWAPIQANANGIFEGDEGTPLAGGWLHFTVDGRTAFPGMGDAQAGRVMLLDAAGHGSVFVNGEPRGGDPYSTGYVQVPVLVKPGANEFLFSVGRGRLAAKLVPPPAPAFVSDRDVLLPSVVSGRDTDGPLGVVVVNASAAPLAGARIRVTSDLSATDAWVELHAMPALTEKKVALPARFAANGLGAAKPGTTVKAMVELVARDGTSLFTLPVALPVVTTTDRRVVTRTSTIDGSAQYYALVPSTARTTDPKPGILFSVHGASVEATGQAAAYAPKKEAHVVCPTNRRPYGFDWEDWGRIDFAEAFAHARSHLANDPLRSWLTGHSMGGHGTWQLGAHFPGEFAAIAPSAGWISFRSYVGTSAGTGEDPAIAMLNRAGKASDTLALKENYMQQGVYVLHGDADDNVPVSEAREMFRQLAAMHHPDFAYYERCGAGHWWGNECVDWPPLTEFLFRHSLPKPESNDFVRFLSVAPQVSSRSAWVRVLQQQVPFEVSKVDVQLDRKAMKVTGTTSNVAMLELVPPLPAAGGERAPLTIVLDGQELTVPAEDKPAPIRLERSPDGKGGMAWSLDPQSSKGDAPHALPATAKKPARGGPFKNAFAHGFVAVVGTQGSDEADRLLLAKARYDADQWWVRGNGRFEIILDSAFDPRQYLGRNLILYGNRDENAATKAVLGDADPVTVANGRYAGGATRVQGDDVAVMYVRPRADCDKGQVGVIAATGAKGMRALMRTPVFVAGVGIPDLVAFRAGMLAPGAAGGAGAVIDAGFFGNDWSIDRGSWMRR